MMSNSTKNLLIMSANIPRSKYLLSVDFELKHSGYFGLVGRQSGVLHINIKIEVQASVLTLEFSLNCVT